MRRYSFAEKKRFVLLFGKIKQDENKIYTFTARPDKECPVMSNNNKSYWSLIDETFTLIKAYSNGENKR